MPGYVLFVDLVGLALAVIGFNMAFRQAAIRRHFGRPGPRQGQSSADSDGQDPLTYVLRIAGVMIMVFGVVIGGMVTLVYLA